MKLGEKLCTYFESEVLSESKDMVSKDISTHSNSESEDSEVTDRKKRSCLSNQKAVTYSIVCNDKLEINIHHQLLQNISSTTISKHGVQNSSNEIKIMNHLGMIAEANYTEFQTEHEKILAVLEPWQENDNSTSSDEDEQYDDLLVPWCKLVPWDKVGAQHCFEGFEESLNTSIDKLTSIVTSNYLYLKIDGFESLRVLLPRVNYQGFFVLKPVIQSTTEYMVQICSNFQAGYQEINLASKTSITNKTSYHLIIYVESDNYFWKNIMGTMSDNPFEGQLKLAVIRPGEEFYVPFFLQEETKFYVRPQSKEMYSISYPAFTSESTQFEKMKISCYIEGKSGEFRLQVQKETSCISKFVISPVFYVLNNLHTQVHIKSAGKTEIKLEPGEKEPVYENIGSELEIYIQNVSLNIIFDPSRKCETGIICNKILGSLQFKLTGEEMEISAEYVLQNCSGIGLIFKDCSGKTTIIPNEHSMFLCQLPDNVMEFAVDSEELEKEKSYMTVIVALPPYQCIVTSKSEHQDLSFQFHVKNSNNHVKEIVISPLWSFLNSTERDMVLKEIGGGACCSSSYVLESKSINPFWPRSEESCSVFTLKYLDGLEETAPFNLSFDHSVKVLKIDQALGLKMSLKKGKCNNNIITIEEALFTDIPLVFDNRCNELIIRIYQNKEKKVWLVKPGTIVYFTWDDYTTKKLTCQWTVQGSHKSFHICLSPAEVLWGQEKIIVQTVKYIQKSSDSDTTDEVN